MAHEDKLVQREFEIHGMVSLESDNCVLDGTGIWGHPRFCSQLLLSWWLISFWWHVTSAAEDSSDFISEINNWLITIQDNAVVMSGWKGAGGINMFFKRFNGQVFLLLGKMTTFLRFPFVPSQKPAWELWAARVFWNEAQMLNCQIAYLDYLTKKTILNSCNACQYGPTSPERTGEFTASNMKAKPQP